MPVALTDDPESARAALRQDLIPYASLPFYRAMLEASGFADEIAAFDAGMAAGDVETREGGALGPDARRAGRDRHRRGRPGCRSPLSARPGLISPGVGGMPGTDFDAALKAVAELI